MPAAGPGAPGLILASASPRRRELLARLGIEPASIDATDIDESPRKAELPRDYARRMAREKALALAGREAHVLAGEASCARRSAPPVGRASARARETPSARADPASPLSTAAADAFALEQLARADVEHVAQRVQQLGVEQADAPVGLEQPIEGRRADPAVALLGDGVSRQPVSVEEFGEADTHGVAT